MLRCAELAEGETLMTKASEHFQSECLVPTLRQETCYYWRPNVLDRTIRYDRERMIRSFGDKRTAALFHDERVRQFEGIARAAKRKLEALNAASRLEDLTIPRSNRLEKLKGNLKDFYSIRINDQWRGIFKWTNGEPHEVRIVDYH